MCAVSPEECVKDVPPTTTAPITSQNVIKYVPTEQYEIKYHTLNNEEQSFTEVHKGFYKEIHSYAKNPLNTRQNVSDQNRENTPILNKLSNAKTHSYAKPYTMTKPPVKKPSTSNTCKSQK